MTLNTYRDSTSTLQTLQALQTMAACWLLPAPAHLVMSPISWQVAATFFTAPGPM